MSLVKSVSKGVFGSAVAGFGLSLGRDLYKGGKKSNDSTPIILVIIVILIGIYISFVSGLWLGRNYKNIIFSIFMKLLSLVMIAAITFFWIGFWNTDSNMVDNVQTMRDVPFSEFSKSWVFWVPFILFILGLLIGFMQRAKRKKAWVAEEFNEKYLKSLGLSELENGELVDKSGQRFRIDSQTKNKITLFAIKRRNKRAFISLGEDGKMNSYSGMVSI